MTIEEINKDGDLKWIIQQLDEYYKKGPSFTKEQKAEIDNILKWSTPRKLARWNNMLIKSKKEESGLGEKFEVFGQEYVTVKMYFSRNPFGRFLKERYPDIEKLFFIIGYCYGEGVVYDGFLKREEITQRIYNYYRSYAFELIY